MRVVWYVVTYFCLPPVGLECQCQFIFLCRLCVCGFRNLEGERGGEMRKEEEEGERVEGGGKCGEERKE